MNNIELEDFKEKAIVEKSQPLFDVFHPAWKIYELKLLAIYLGKIDARNPKSRTVTITMKELENLFGVTRVYPQILDKHLENLFQSIQIVDPDTKKIVRIGLFSKTTITTDDNGQVVTILKCTDDAKKYFFNIEKIGYIQNRMKNYLGLNSSYSILMLDYLFHNEYQKEWIENIQTLKEIIKCDDTCYQEFKYFNSKILVPAKKEINEKTDITFDYFPIREGRKIKYLRFTVERKAKLLDNNEIVNVDPVVQNFETFWEAYPRKEKKQEAENVWTSLNPNEELAQLIIAKVNEWKKTQQWTEDSGKYIPHASNWLADKRWEDEVLVESNNKNHSSTKVDSHKPSYDANAYREKAQEDIVYPGKNK